MFGLEKYDWSIGGNIDAIFINLYAWRMARRHLTQLKASLPKATSIEQEARRDTLFPIFYGFVSLVFAEAPGSQEFANYMNQANDVIAMVRSIESYD